MEKNDKKNQILLFLLLFWYRHYIIKSHAIIGRKSPFTHPVCKIIIKKS